MYRVRTDTVEDDKEYFYKRAENELEMAQRAEIPAVVRAHYMLASHYLDMVYNDDAPHAANDEPHAHGAVAG